jgi:hypothetical protein
MKGRVVSATVAALLGKPETFESLLVNSPNGV